MRADDLGRAEPRLVALVNPPVSVVDSIQLDYYADALPLGLHQIAGWLISHGHDVHLADMMGYGKHQYDWDQLVARGELTPSGTLRSGAPGLDLDVWLYGKTLAWLSEWFDGLSRPPDEVWVSCAMSFNAFAAHQVVKLARERFPDAIIRFGGSHATLSPEDAASSGADDVFRGRLHGADVAWPSPAGPEPPVDFALYRLTTGCPNKCAFCVNSRWDLRAYPVAPIIDYIATTRRSRGIRKFNNWDPNILRFRDQLDAFLRRLVDDRLDVELRFDMGFEPILIDDGLIDLIKAANVRSFSVPLETSDPAFAGFFGKPYTILSAIRALEKLRSRGFDLRQCHGTSVIGYPDEKLDEVFAVYHVTRAYGLHSTPFPIVPLPNSPVYAKYGARLEGRTLAEHNGHLYPLLRDPSQIERYRRLLMLLTSGWRGGAERIEDFPQEVQAANERGLERAKRLIDFALSSDEDDGPGLLARVAG